MQSVAEFVERRDDLVEGQQSGFALRRLGDIEMVAHHRPVAEQMGLRDIGVHPSAAALVGTGVKVGDEQRQRLAGDIEHFEHAHIFLIYRQVEPFLEADAVQFFGGEENPAQQHIVEFEIGPQLALVEIEAFGAQDLRVISPVPSGQGKVLARVIDHLLQIRRFAAGVGGGRRREFRQTPVHRVHRTRGFVFQNIGGMIFVTEQSRSFGAQPQHFGQSFAVIVCSAAGAARQRGFQYALAQLAIPQARQRRLSARIEQRQYEAAGQIPRFGFVFRRGDERLVQSGQFFPAVDDDSHFVDFAQHVLAEAGLQHSEPRIDIPQLRLLLFAQRRSRPDEIDVGSLEQAMGFRIQAQFVPAFIQTRNAREQVPIQQNRIAMRREFRRQLLLQRLNVIVGMGARQGEKDRSHAVEQLPAQLERDDRILEIRRGLLAGDSFHFRNLLGHAALERGLIMLVGDQIESRVVEIMRTVREKRIVGHLDHRRRFGLGVKSRRRHRRPILAGAGPKRGEQQCRPRKF